MALVYFQCRSNLGITLTCSVNRKQCRKYWFWEIKKNTDALPKSDARADQKLLIYFASPYEDHMSHGDVFTDMSLHTR